jgi:hypothetical protein
MSIDDLEFRARLRATAANQCFFVVADSTTGRAFVTDNPTFRSQILRVAAPHTTWPITP